MLPEPVNNVWLTLDNWLWISIWHTVIFCKVWSTFRPVKSCNPPVKQLQPVVNLCAKFLCLSPRAVRMETTVKIWNQAVIVALVAAICVSIFACLAS